MEVTNYKYAINQNYCHCVYTAQHKYLYGYNLYTPTQLLQHYQQNSKVKKLKY